MDKNMLEMIMTAMHDQGEVDAYRAAAIKVCRAEQREYAEDAEESGFKHREKLSGCIIKVSTVLAALNAQDDPIALHIFAKHEQKILEEQCTTTIAKDHVETTPNTEDDEDE